MHCFAKRFLRDEAGATAIEYGLIAALISISIIAAASVIGGGVQANFERVSSFISQ
jgi:pilus assembly protein Flp/PilA